VRPHPAGVRLEGQVDDPNERDSIGRPSHVGDQDWGLIRSGHVVGFQDPQQPHRP